MNIDIKTPIPNILSTYEGSPTPVPIPEKNNLKYNIQPLNNIVINNINNNLLSRRGKPQLPPLYINN